MRLTKPRAVPKSRPSLLTKRDQAKAALAEERRVRAAVKKRDGGLCRVLIVYSEPGGGSVWRRHRGNQMHHIIPKSLGGKDTTANCIWICDRCHQERHAGVIRITGNGDHAITVERIWS